jgi:hypothetical protein
MSKGLKIMSLGVINHGMSLSVLYYQDVENFFLCDDLLVLKTVLKICFVFQDDTYTESYISTIGVDFVSI